MLLEVWIGLINLYIEVWNSNKTYLTASDTPSISKCNFHYNRQLTNKKFIKNSTKHLYRKSPCSCTKILSWVLTFSSILRLAFITSLIVSTHQQSTLFINYFHSLHLHHCLHQNWTPKEFLSATFLQLSTIIVEMYSFIVIATLI